MFCFVHKSHYLTHVHKTAIYVRQCHDGTFLNTFLCSMNKLFIDYFILGKLKAQHFSSPSSRLVENNTSGSGGLGSSFTSGRLFRKIFTLDYPYIPCWKNIYFSSDTDKPCTEVKMEHCNNIVANCRNNKTQYFRLRL